MSRKIELSIGEYYHVFNRGVDKRKVFLNKFDYCRFTKLLRIANSFKSIHLYHDRGLASVAEDRLVSIGAWSLMPNHFHILLKEIQPNGISIFMHKLSTAYTMFFNKKYERTGSLFAGVFKAVHIQSDQHLKYLYSYIHLNPVQKITVALKSIPMLNTYTYSSFKDYMGILREENNILFKQDFPNYFENPNDHITELLQWLNYDTEAKPRYG